MSYQALARKWRPRRFSELVGQAHVVRALSHALAQQRLHHALLFSGTRGVGKTTLGRIVAKCLNCEHGISAEPCVGELCGACAEIEQGRFVDLIEVDAASRTGVDDTRELMDNVQYAPARGRRKVYLIDEVHMLSRQAFNALLKTLEEPPGHVQFLLATTDPQKVPVTVLSRCLQFPLKRLPVIEIGGQIERILAAEGIAADADAIAAIAKAADGSMRDGLSLLDQAVAYGGGALRAGEVHDMLGTVAATDLGAVLEAIAASDAPALLAALGRLNEAAPDYGAVLNALASAWHRIAVLQLVPAAAGEDDAAYAALAQRLAPADVQLYYDIALDARRDLDWAPDPMSGLEMACLRMLAFAPDTGDVAPAPASGGAAPAKVGRGHANASSAAGPAPAKPPAAAPPSGAPPQAAQKRAADTPSGPGVGEGEGEAAPTAAAWDALVGRLGLRGVAAELARQCVCRRLDAEQVALEVPAALENLLTARARAQVQNAVQAALESQAQVKIAVGAAAGESPARRASDRDARRQDAAAKAIAQDPNVRALTETLGAHVDPASIKPQD